MFVCCDDVLGKMRTMKLFFVVNGRPVRKSDGWMLGGGVWNGGV